MLGGMGPTSPSVLASSSSWSEQQVRKRLQFLELKPDIPNEGSVRRGTGAVVRAPHTPPTFCLSRSAAAAAATYTAAAAVVVALLLRCH